MKYNTIQTMQHNHTYTYILHMYNKFVNRVFNKTKELLPILDGFHNSRFQCVVCTLENGKEL